MLSQEVEERLAEHLVNRIEEANTYILKKIGEAIKQISILTPSQAYQISQILKYGGTYNEIAKELARVSGKNVQDIYKIFEEVAKNNKQFAKQFYKYRGIDYIPYKKDIALQNMVRSLATITADMYRNISNTSVIGFIQDGTFKQLQQVYQDTIDKAILSISQGKQDFYSSMRQTIKELGGSGLVQYESGRTRRLDSVVRMNILDGIRQVNQETANRFGQQYGADGMEVSVHANPAPDHADMQGRQFSLEEFEKLQNGEEAKDYKGRTTQIEHSKNGSYRMIEEYNCYHKAFPIVLGVSKPEYTDKQLKDIRESNLSGFEFEGKHYTMYERNTITKKNRVSNKKTKRYTNISKVKWRYRTNRTKSK